jgi:hypothetical protein
MGAYVDLDALRLERDRRAHAAATLVRQWAYRLDQLAEAPPGRACEAATPVVAEATGLPGELGFEQLLLACQALDNAAAGIERAQDAVTRRSSAG